MKQKIRNALFIFFILAACATAWVYALNYAPEIHIR